MKSKIKKGLKQTEKLLKCKCGRGSKRYNPDNRWGCKDEDRVCSHCFKELKAERQKKKQNENTYNRF